MTQIQPVLKEFMWAMERSVNEAARVGDDTSVFKDQCLGEQEGDQEFKEERDNVIYNMGVKDGIGLFVDHLHEAGYVITDKEGSVVMTEPNETNEPALTFSQTFFTTNWCSVNS